MNQTLSLTARPVTSPACWAELPLPETLPADSGVQWPNDADVTPLSRHFAQLSCICLHFPAFADGRAYSQARVLRRLGYHGALHAAGQAVALDQALELRAAGFDAVVLRDDQKPEQWADWLARNPENGVFTADRAAFLRR